MRLSELRKVAVKQSVRIRFALSNGMECVVNERGIAEVPGLRAVPTFNLEEELGKAQEFALEPVIVGAVKEKDRPKVRRCTRTEMAGIVSAGGPGEVAHDDHDE